MKYFKQLTISGLLLIFASSVMAMPISGTLEMIGAAYLKDASGNNTSNASLAVAIDFNPNKFIVTLADGDFTGLTGQIGVIQNFQFDSFVSPIADFWTIKDFSFELMDVSIADLDGSGSFLALKGQGIISAGGFDDTAAIWSYSSDSSGGGVFGWSATNLTNVPEPGVLVLLSLGLIGISLRKLI